MKRTIAFLAAIAFCAVGPAYAIYGLSNEGTWPKSWPKELEPLRKQSRTLVGPMMAHRHYAIPFTKREEIESTWPHILKVKSKGAPVFLVRGPNFFLGEHAKAGVVVHCPPLGQADNPATPEAAIPGVVDARMKWTYTTFIELVVDGEIVDLNRIPLPADTPIIDELPRKLNSPKDCPSGLQVTASPNDGMIDFIVRIDPDKVEQNDLYKGRVTAICHLDLSLAKERVAYTQLHASTDNKQTVFRFTISAGAAKSSHLDLNTRLHEADGFPTLGGGRTFQIYLTGFLPSGQ